MPNGVILLESVHMRWCDTIVREELCEANYGGVRPLSSRRVGVKSMMMV
jgi:hypothetical protein